MPNGVIRDYITKPILGSIAKSSKTAKHSYRNVFWKNVGNLKVHQLVCEAFHGPKPFDKAVVINLDENGLNNIPENLKWGTQRENLNSPGFKEYCKSRIGENSPVIKGRNK